ncbi:hypothetical protein F5B19DRAFT_478791 [Rostrohypoxylon terebratum]|nr:hypothetical protein F5B19DRAFT_478791 [Rostrohypoxylon terebratum]
MEPICEIKSAASQNRVSANIHIEKPVVVPVAKGWVVDLIPVCMMKGGADGRR